MNKKIASNSKALTASEVKKYIKLGKPIRKSDGIRTRGDSRLYLKVTCPKRGTKAVWVFQWFDQNHKKRTLEIGKVSTSDTNSNTTGKLTLREARLRCSDLAELVRQGLDPKQEIMLTRIREQQKREEELSALELKRRRNITLNEYWPNYLETAKSQKGMKSLEKEISHFQNWLSSNVGNIPLKDINFDTWGFLVDTLTKSGLAPRTREYICLTLRQVLNHAFARKVIPMAAPSSKLIGATTKGEDNRRTRIITDEELRIILEKLKERSIADFNFTLFCTLTGCRASEAFNLTWAQVDLRREEVTFLRTKNKSNRTIYLSTTLVDMIQSLPRREPTDVVFLSTRGKPYQEAPMLFRKIVAELGLNADRERRDRIVFHSLRHTAATKWGRDNIPLRDLMDAGGWKTPSMALRYQHSGKEIQRKAMNTLERAISSSKNNVIPFPNRAQNE